MSIAKFNALVHTARYVTPNGCVIACTPDWLAARQAVDDTWETLQEVGENPETYNANQLAEAALTEQSMRGGSAGII